ncbi:hypothetical protein [Membranihabitans marinus]|uniref:hypothetical protein n=1 Tax=Membranihabitans marinus TaxID=1227546 RepID=UPI001F2910CB|nr:hypothetical protein [Membranihabitans marinus]
MKLNITRKSIMSFFRPYLISINDKKYHRLLRNKELNITIDKPVNQMSFKLDWGGKMYFDLKPYRDRKNLKLRIEENPINLIGVLLMIAIFIANEITNIDLLNIIQLIVVTALFYLNFYKVKYLYRIVVIK